MQVGLMLTSEAIDELAMALSAVQGEIKDASKDSLNPHLKSKYADLAEVLQTVRPILSKNHLALTQGVSYDNGQVHVTSRLMHGSGQWVESMISIPVSKQDAQGIGAATTYGRRYGAAALIGISQDDDDGESIKAGQRRPKENTGTNNPTPVLSTPTTPSQVAKAVIAKFDQLGKSPEHKLADESEMKALTAEFTSLTPAEQTQVLPAAKAARARLEGVKTTPSQ